MIKKLPKWAELSVASACAASGAIAHRPEEDENGWDYLIEFGQEKHLGPADTHPPMKSAFVQIKSTKKRRLDCRVKLSNALKAAQAQQPWFVVLVIAVPRKPIEIYAVHLWDKFIAHTLRNVRAAENARCPLNNCSLTIKFSASDRHDNDLISWMQNLISLYEPGYQQKKEKFYRDVGYEEGSGIANTTIISKNHEDLANNFLGLGDGLDISHFSFTQSRFGLVSPVPDIDIKASGKLHVTPNPIDTCELRLRAFGFSYSLKGSVYSLGMPILAEKEGRIRFSADFIELVVSEALEVKTFKANLDPDEKTTLYNLEAFGALNAWRGEGVKPNLQVWTKGSRVLFGDIELSQRKQRTNWALFVVALRVIREIATGQGDSLKLSLREILMGGHRLSIFAQAIRGPGFKLVVPTESEMSAKIDSLVFYSYAEVGDFLFYALCESDFRGEIVTGAGREIFFDAARIVESYVISDPTPGQRDQMAADYNRHLKGLGKDGDPLGIGELLEFSAQSSAIAK